LYKVICALNQAHAGIGDAAAMVRQSMPARPARETFSMDSANDKSMFDKPREMGNVIKRSMHISGDPARFVHCRLVEKKFLPAEHRQCCNTLVTQLRTVDIAA
jgi:hypothetical protein